MRLLLVEDDNHVAAALSAVLARHGFDVTHARSGEEALQALVPESDGFGVVLLDLGLPDQDGYEVCGKIRKRTSTPVIMVTAGSELYGRGSTASTSAPTTPGEALDTGELLARIHAVSRRSVPDDAGGSGDSALRLGPVRIELPTRQVSVDGSVVQLTRKEFDLLALLAQRPGVVFRREQIISEVWRTSWEGTRHTLEVHVAHPAFQAAHAGADRDRARRGYRLVAPTA